MHFQCFPFSPNSDAFETLETLKNGARSLEEIAKTDATAVIFANLHRKRQLSSLNAVSKNVLKRDDPCTLNLITAIKTKPPEKNHNKKKLVCIDGRRAQLRADGPNLNQSKSAMRYAVA